MLEVLSTDYKLMQLESEVLCSIHHFITSDPKELQLLKTQSNVALFFSCRLRSPSDEVEEEGKKSLWLWLKGT